MAHRRDERNIAGGRRAHDDLLIKTPEIFQRAAAARDDQHIGARNAPALGQRVKAVDGARDLRRAGLALHPHRPHQHVTRKAVGEAMQDIADDGASRRGDDADDLWHEWQQLLAGGIEQTLRPQLFGAQVQQRKQRAHTCRLDAVDDNLVGRLAREGGDLAGGNNLHALLGPHAQPREGALPHHRIDPGGGVLQTEIDMSGGMRAPIARNLAAHAHIAEPVLDRALERARELGDGEFGGIGGGRILRWHGLFMPD